MPVADVQDMDDLEGVVGAAFGNAGISGTFDHTWGVCSECDYFYWQTPDGDFKPYMYMTFWSIGVALYACDNIYFYNVYDDETGELIGRCVSISGSYSIGSVSFSAGNVYYNSVTNKVAVIAQGSKYLGYFERNSFDGRSWAVALANGVYYPMASKEYADIQSIWQSLGDINRVYPALVRSGSAYFIRLDSDILSEIGSSGQVIQIDSEYYYNVADKFAVKVGDVGVSPAVVAEYHDFIEALPVLDASEVFLAEVGGVLADLVTNPDLLPEGFTFTVFTSPTSEIDERIAEEIQEHPEEFPETGQAVLDKSKRIITRLEFG